MWDPYESTNPIPAWLPVLEYIQNIFLYFLYLLDWFIVSCTGWFYYAILFINYLIVFSILTINIPLFVHMSLTHRNTKFYSNVLYS